MRGIPVAACPPLKLDSMTEAVKAWIVGELWCWCDDEIEKYWSEYHRQSVGIVRRVPHSPQSKLATDKEESLA